jgi:hypothetical protein
MALGDAASVGVYRLEFNKYVNSSLDGGTTNVFVNCFAAIAPQSAGAPPWLDGNWHHFVAISSSTGMAIYLDGNAQTCTTPTNSQLVAFDIQYAGRGSDFFVGRHGFNNVNFDFQGNIDDVRVYDRVLAGPEILALALGMHLPP